jgi:uncharacterized protein YsxB (DUF464 family)
MINVKIGLDGCGFINRYTIKGHANFGAYGEDIVCAAVSILGHTALRSLVDVCNIDESELSYKVDDETGLLDVKIFINPEDFRIKNVQIVMKTFIVGIKSLVETYPKNVTLEYRGGVMNA